MTEFDKYKDSYEQAVQRSISFAGQDHGFFTRVKAQHLLDVTRRHVGEPSLLTALDVGSGAGATDRHLSGSFRSLRGIDVSEGMVAAARSTNPDVEYRSYDGGSLPYAEGAFDIVFTICVMHHVPPAQWPAFTREMARVTAPGGLAIVFEHNPLNPLTRLAVARCEFDDDAVLLRRSTTRRLLAGASLLPVESSYVLVLPWDVAAGRVLERGLRKVPLGAQYYVAALKPGPRRNP